MTVEGRGCGAVGRTVAFDTRDPLFRIPTPAEKYFNCQLQFRKDENKEKEAGIGPLRKDCR